MNIEQIDENKIKVTVSSDDQKEYGVTYETMNYSDANTRRLCEKIMSLAGREIGFKIGNARLLVEARQTCNGNVTLFLSKISLKQENKPMLENSLCFSDLNALLDACKAFMPYISSLKKSSLYSFKDKYYLFFNINQSRPQIDALNQVLLEYGEKTLLSKFYLQEHGTVIGEKGIIEKILGIKNLVKK